MNKIVLASNNKHKIEEFKKILDNYEILSLFDIGFNEDIVEDGKTFFDNALIKAKTTSLYLRDKGLDYSVIADDSGLCCEGINLEPGVYSARYAGDHGDDQKNRDKLLKELENVENRKAYFVCSLVMYNIDDTYISCEGRSYGEITHEEIGDTSFGYDPLFLSDDLGITFGEANEEEKNSVSHRGRAIEKLKEMM